MINKEKNIDILEKKEIIKTWLTGQRSCTLYFHENLPGNMD